MEQQDKLSNERWEFIKVYYSRFFEEAPPILKGYFLKKEGEKWRVYTEDNQPLDAWFTGVDDLYKGGYIVPISDKNPEECDATKAEESGEAGNTIRYGIDDGYFWLNGTPYTESEILEVMKISAVKTPLISKGGAEAQKAGDGWKERFKNWFYGNSIHAIPDDSDIIDWIENNLLEKQ